MNTRTVSRSCLNRPYAPRLEFWSERSERGCDLTRIGSVHIPVATHLAVPAVITCGEDSESTDRALPALLITVEKVDGERLPLCQSLHEGWTQLIVGVSHG